MLGLKAGGSLAGPPHEFNLTQLLAIIRGVPHCFGLIYPLISYNGLLLNLLYMLVYWLLSWHLVKECHGVLPWKICGKGLVMRCRALFSSGKGVVKSCPPQLFTSGKRVMGILWFSGFLSLLLLVKALSAFFTNGKRVVYSFTGAFTMVKSWSPF